LLAAQPVEANWQGSVTSAIDRATVERAGWTMPLSYGSGLLRQDRLRTSGQGGLGLLLGNDLVVYLGAASEAQLDVTPRGWSIELRQGELRATCAGGTPLIVMTADGEARIGQAILRVSNDRYGSRFGVEHGDAAVTPAGGEPRRLVKGQSLRVGVDGVLDLLTYNAADWTIRVADFQRAALASADEHERRRRGGLPPSQDPSGAGAADVATSAGAAESASTAQQAAASTTRSQGTGINTSGSAAAGAALSFGFGFGSGSTASVSSGGIYADAGNRVQPTARFIHLVTAETSYSLDNVRITDSDGFPRAPEYWSIGVGAVPTQLVEDRLDIPTPSSTLDHLFQSDASPTTLPIPGTDAYLLRIYPFDPLRASPGDVPAANDLHGDPPATPIIANATPFLDQRAEFNDRLTFALGEIVIDRDAADQARIGIRRSDQDRLAVPVTSARDREVPNPQVTSRQGINAVGQVDSIPQSLQPAPTFRTLDPIRRAAVTTLLADRLTEYARRTGQTRFVVDGKLVDISGYRGTSAPR
jgi:hypothetical protein